MARVGNENYQTFMLGFALVLFAIAIALTGRIHRPIGYVMGLAGHGSFVVGWQEGVEGFAPSTNGPLMLWSVLLLVFIVWLLVVARRMNESPQPAEQRGRPSLRAPGIG